MDTPRPSTRTNWTRRVLNPKRRAAREGRGAGGDSAHLPRGGVVGVDDAGPGTRHKSLILLSGSCSAGLSNPKHRCTCHRARELDGALARGPASGLAKKSNVSEPRLPPSSSKSVVSREISLERFLSCLFSQEISLSRNFLRETSQEISREGALLLQFSNGERVQLVRGEGRDVSS